MYHLADPLHDTDGHDADDYKGQESTSWPCDLERLAIDVKDGDADYRTNSNELTSNEYMLCMGKAHEQIFAIHRVLA